MKPDSAETVFLPERSLVNGVQALTDEEVNGEYGLVINGHSLVGDACGICHSETHKLHFSENRPAPPVFFLLSSASHFSEGVCT